MAPLAFLAGCEPTDYMKAKGTEFIASSMEAAKNFIDSSLHGWYGFVGQIYGTMIDVILHTPEQLIANPEIQRLWLIFVGVSISFLSVMCVIEAFRIMFGKSRSNLFDILMRTGASFLAMSFVLPAMTFGLSLINSIVDYFVSIAHHNMDPAQYFGETLGQSFANGGINFLASVVFLLLFLLYIFKILLYYGRRWFDIMVAAIISPLTVASTIFDSTSKYFQMWWNHIIQLYLVQVVHAVYVMVLGLIVLTPGEIKNASDAFIRILLLIGALWRMSEPPAFIGNIAPSPTHNMVKGIISKFRFRGVKS